MLGVIVPAEQSSHAAQVPELTSARDKISGGSKTSDTIWTSSFGPTLSGTLGGYRFDVIM